MKVYSYYSREDALCQTNGSFSLNLRVGSIPAISRLLSLKAGDTVGWMGCGDGRELFSIAMNHPDVQFCGIDINEHAIRIANRTLGLLNLKNVKIRCEDIMNHFDTYSHVYSTAIGGPDLYEHVYSLSKYKLCMLREMWSPLPATHEKETVRISGSGERRQLVCKAIVYEQ